MASGKTIMGITIVIVLAIIIYLVLSMVFGLIRIFFSKWFWIIVLILGLVYLLLKMGLGKKK